MYEYFLSLFWTSMLSAYSHAMLDLSPPDSVTSHPGQHRSSALSQPPKFLWPLTSGCQGTSPHMINDSSASPQVVCFHFNLHKAGDVLLFSRRKWITHTARGVEVWNAEGHRTVRYITLQRWSNQNIPDAPSRKNVRSHFFVLSKWTFGWTLGLCKQIISSAIYLLKYTFSCC